MLKDDHLRESVKGIIWGDYLRGSERGIFDEGRRDGILGDWNSKRGQIEQFYWLNF